MSKLGIQRRLVNWESSCARCVNCLHFKDTNIYLINSMPREQIRHCGKYGFKTNHNSVCDAWLDKVTKQALELPPKKSKVKITG